MAAGGSGLRRPFDIQARLRIPTGTDAGEAKLLLEKAEKNCFISNSLDAEFSMTVSVESN